MEHRSARIAVAVFISLLLGSAGAQMDGGVKVETDEFTGEVSCQQTVFARAGNPTGVSMRRAEGMTFVYVFRSEQDWEPAFNMFGVVGGEVVYVRWPDGTVEEHEPDHVEFDADNGIEIAAFMNHQLALRLMASPADVRVRFDGPNRSADFTIDHSIVTALAQGFGQQCLE